MKFWILKFYNTKHNNFQIRFSEIRISDHQLFEIKMVSQKMSNKCICKFHNLPCTICTVLKGYL